MKIKSLLVATCTLFLFASTAFAQSTSKYSNPNNWKWEKGTIVTQTPARSEGQKSVLNLSTPRLQTVRVAFVGLGMRGPGAVNRFTHIPGVQIVRNTLEQRDYLLLISIQEKRDMKSFASALT